MDRIQVLIVDQNILVRRAITNILQKYEGFDICWIADESSQIESRIRDDRPDVVLLSIDDMESDGYGFTILSMLRLKFPDLPLIVISPRSEKGAEAAINALRLGAIDFITKPEHKNLILFAERHLEKRLKPLINAARDAKDRDEISSEILEALVHPQKSFEQINKSSKVNTRPDILVLGGCTGGSQALFSLIPALPANLPVPVVIVQHLPRTYTKYLAAKLDSISNVSVREARDEVALEGGSVWVAPGGFQCEVSRSGYKPILHTHRGLRENNMRPSIDILFRSAVQVYGNRTLGVLLSGCGSDGLDGAEQIRKQDGEVWVQDPRSAIAPELPLSAIKKGITREYYSPEDIAERVIQLINQPKDNKVVEEQDVSTVGDTIIF